MLKNGSISCHLTVGLQYTPHTFMGSVLITYFLVSKNITPDVLYYYYYYFLISFLTQTAVNFQAEDKEI